jgi:hypothetical protein
MLLCHATGLGSTMAEAGPGHGQVDQQPGPAKGPGTLRTPGPRPWVGLKRHLAMAWPRRRHRAALAWGMAWQHMFGNEINKQIIIHQFIYESSVPVVGPCRRSQSLVQVVSPSRRSLSSVVGPSRRSQWSVPVVSPSRWSQSLVPVVGPSRLS